MTVAIYYTLITSNFFFFKDDLINLYQAYVYGLDTISLPTGGRGFAPLYRLVFLLLTNSEGPNFTLARALVVFLMLGLYASSYILLRSLAPTRPQIQMFSALIVCSYPLLFGSIKWISSAFHVLPVLLASVIAVQLFYSTMSFRYRVIGITSLLCLAAGFDSGQAMLLGTALVLTSVISKLLEQKKIAIKFFEFGSWRLLTLVAVSVLITASLLGLDSVEDAEKGVQSTRSYLLYALVYFKSIIKYSPVGFFLGNNFYLDHGFLHDLLVLLLLLFTFFLVRKSPYKALMHYFLVSALILGIAITLVRTSEFGWVIIPEHRYYIILMTLLLLFFLLSLNLRFSSLNHPEINRIKNEKHAKNSGIYTGILACIFLAYIYFGEKFSRKVFYQDEVKVLATEIETIAREVETGIFNQDSCAQPLPQDLQLSIESFKKKVLLASYFSDGRVICERFKLPLVGP